MTAQELKACIPMASQVNCDKFAEPLTKAMAMYEIDKNPLRIAAFMAQIGHESLNLSRTVENLNYSTVGLLATFPRYFRTPKETELYARRPEKIANKVYGGRYGNGDEASGDGWRYRGAGLIQITFKDNFRDAGKALGYDFVADPEAVQRPGPASFTAAWYWGSRGLNSFADKGDLVMVTKRINPALKGMDDRMTRYEVAKKAMGVS